MRLEIGLWYLGNKVTYRELGEQFGVSESCAFSCVQTIIEILCDVANDYIKWPTQAEAVEVETIQCCGWISRCYRSN